jgi:hypothetical protein
MRLWRTSDLCAREGPLSPRLYWRFLKSRGRLEILGSTAKEGSAQFRAARYSYFELLQRQRLERSNVAHAT